MRRTEQEFKAEVLRRSENYRMEQSRKRKKLLGVGVCAVLCVAALWLFEPLAMGGNNLTAAPEAAPQAPEAEMSFIEIDGNSMEFFADDAMPAESAEEPAAAAPLAEEGILVLNAEDAAYILQYLSGEWIPSTANCLCDYTVEIDGATYRYHSDCGTFQNEDGHSLTLAEEARLIINRILESY